jgi:hypothetical protein
MDDDGVKKGNDEQKKSEWICEKKTNQAHPSNLAFLIQYHTVGYEIQPDLKSTGPKGLGARELRSLEDRQTSGLTGGPGFALGAIIF